MLLLAIWNWQFDSGSGGPTTVDDDEAFLTDDVAWGPTTDPFLTDNVAGGPTTDPFLTDNVAGVEWKASSGTTSRSAPSASFRWILNLKWKF
jgi:hypothetical protein